MIRRTITIAAIVMTAVLALAGTASAQYVDSATVNNPTPTPGQTVVVSGTCATPGATVTVVLDVPGAVVGDPAAAALTGGTVLATGTVNADGTFSLNVTIPPGTSLGAHTLTVYCAGKPIAVLGINVQSPSATTGTTGTTGTAGTSGTTGTSGSTGGTTTGSTAPLARTGTNFAPVLAIGALLLAAGGLFLLTSRKRRRTDA